MLRLKGVTVKLPVLDIGFERTSTDVGASTSTLGQLLRPEAVLSLADEAEAAASKQGDLLLAVERLLALAGEFAPSDRKQATRLSAVAHSLERDHANGRITSETLYLQRAELFGELLDLTALYRMHAKRLLTQLEKAEQRGTSSAENGGKDLDRNDVLPSSVAVRCAGVGWAVPNKRILKGVTFDAEAGQVLGIVGRNGSGKTTLLRIVARQTAPTDGNILFPRLSQAGASWGEIGDSIGYAAQVPPPYYGPVEAILRRYAALRGIVGEQNDAETEYTMQRFGLSAHAKTDWANLSGGMKTRFELARLALAYPSILILDEPLAPLDPPSQREYLRAIRDLVKSARQTAIIMTSQELDAVEEVADRILVLRDGQTDFFGPRTEIGGRDSPCLYEVSMPVDGALLQSALANVPGTCVTKRGSRFLIQTERSVSKGLLLRALLDVSEDITNFRDLTCSAHRIIDEAD